MSDWIKKNPEKRKLYQRKTWLRANYGMTLEDFQALLDSQGGRCAICRDELRRPHMDHCHKTGRIRGILCSGCNTGLGLFRDCPAHLQAAASYIKKFS